MSALDEEVAAVLEGWSALKSRAVQRPPRERPVGAVLAGALDALEERFEQTAYLRHLERVLAAAVELRDAASSQDPARITRAYTAVTTALDEWKAAG